METSRIHKPRPSRLIVVPFVWEKERRVRCFRVVDGELQATPCPEDGGIGTLIERGTKAVGIQPCGGCARRKAVLDAATPNWVRRLFGKL